MTARRRGLVPAAGWAAAGIVPLAFLAICFVLPVGTILSRGLGGGAVFDLIGRRSTGRLIWFTTWQALVSTAATFAVGLPASWALARLDIPGGRLLRALLIVPFVLPTLVVAAAVEAASDGLGFESRGTLGGIIAAHVMLNTAIVIRVVGGRWALMGTTQEEAAAMLGASRLRILAGVTIPRLAPALWSAAAIVFLFCFTSFGVILTIGGPGRPTLETEIWRHATQRTDIRTAAALAVLQLAAVVALLVASNVLERRAEPIGASPPRRRRVDSPRRAFAAVAALGPALALLVLPLLTLVERSVATDGGHGLDHYRALGERGRTGLFVPAADAIGNSIRTAVVAAAIATVIGALASLVVVHTRRGRILDLALMVPLGTSAVTVGFGILVALGRPPLDLRSTWIIVPLAQALVGIPFVIRSVVPALRSVDPRQREAAAVLGASPRTIRREVDGPIARRGVLAGAAFAFAISLGEFGATSFLARPDAPTVPVAMFRLLGRPGDALTGQAMALGTVLAVLTVISVLVIERLRPTDTLGW